jgi:hypothetical protein
VCPPARDEAPARQANGRTAYSSPYFTTAFSPGHLRPAVCVVITDPDGRPLPNQLLRCFDLTEERSAAHGGGRFAAADTLDHLRHRSCARRDFQKTDTRCQAS